MLSIILDAVGTMKILALILRLLSFRVDRQRVFLFSIDGRRPATGLADRGGP